MRPNRDFVDLIEFFFVFPEHFSFVHLCKMSGRHSAGCIVAADAYFKAPERIAALVLVAPALIAPLVLKKNVEAKREKSTMTEAFLNIGERIGCIFRKITAVIQRILSSISQLWRSLLAAALRSDFGHWLIRIIMDKFSLQAVRLAWYNKDKVDEYVITGYTKPLRCRDWEHALLEYVIALIEGPSTNDIDVPVSQRLDQMECPVLIISGDSDALVPAWNAERLSKVLPNAQCHIIKNCGHLPQEETPEEFLSIIQRFIHQIQLGVFQERNPQGIMSDSPA
ncbi:hypothetical protein KP509_16G071100 [Ceratopteris richardii]|uniref:AB hydrolase-1 domain-containing protein n=1 Tax=Ceratopteris richardii TaxID=49495 RepID=A0A8T2T3F5_CERRI|nr:hypothetical protein KP509_16G071100 [Ceratopteris richardii]